MDECPASNPKAQGYDFFFSRLSAAIAFREAVLADVERLGAVSGPCSTHYERKNYTVPNLVCITDFQTSGQWWICRPQPPPPPIFPSGFCLWTLQTLPLDFAFGLSTSGDWPVPQNTWYEMRQMDHAFSAAAFLGPASSTCTLYPARLDLTTFWNINLSKNGRWWWSRWSIGFISWSVFSASLSPCPTMSLWRAKSHHKCFFIPRTSFLQGLGFGLLYWSVSRQRDNCFTESPG